MAKSKDRVFQKAAIPAGFEQVQGGQFPPVHDFEKNDTLTGTMQEIKSVAAKIGRKAQTTRIMYVADSEGVLSSVWESAALEKLFDEVKKGDQVYIHYDGPIAIKGRKQPMKGFTCAIKAANAKK